MLVRAAGLDDALVIVARDPRQGGALRSGICLEGRFSGFGGLLDLPASLDRVNPSRQQGPRFVREFTRQSQRVASCRGVVAHAGAKSHLPALAGRARKSVDPARGGAAHAQIQAATIAVVALARRLHLPGAEEV